VTWDEKGEAHFFADTDVYMSEDAVFNSPIRDMLLRWADEGWLHIVPGKTFDPSVVLSRIMELDGKGVNFAGFGYDRFNAKIVINALSQWLFDIGLDPNQIVLPIQQSYGSYNPVVIEFEYMVRRMKGVEHSPMISFSENPMWPWQFGNTMLAVSNDGHENHMPVKGGAPSGKVDSVQMLLCALMLYDMSEGKISK
jgi:phage terminase large subunit-like protein